MNEATKKALESSGLIDYFTNLPASHQREYLSWINDAKKPETQQKRINKMLDMLKSKKNR